MSGVVVLDRIEPGKLPDYCIHGRATCVTCDNWVWLGDKTHDIVANGTAAPICRECANRLIPPDRSPVEHISDRRRTEGPHE